MTIAELRQRFLNPRADDRMMPLWFWNDHLDRDELSRQIRDFADHGWGGFVLHPRLGLPRDPGYLSDGWFEYVQHACRLAAELGLKVIIYDEGVYPSGCSNGLVTREHPEFRARGLQAIHRDVDGSGVRYWRAVADEWFDDHLVAAAVCRLSDDGQPDYGTTRRLDAEAQSLVRLELGAGRWRAMAWLDVPTGGHTRGVYVGEDDLDADPPPSADLLNPAATAKFIETTHERYAAAVGDLFGETILAFFVDEPSLSGRGPRRRGLLPWTGGLLDTVAEAAGLPVERLLPALFDEHHPDAKAARQHHEQVVADRLNHSFFGPLSTWCRQHGLALVGHPDRSDEFHALERFDWPGQDMVWRYVEPARPTALEGAHSTASRAASSAKRYWNRSRAAVECLGAYGWRLTADEMKWLFDWHLAHGNDLLLPHAVYYSMRGPRCQERPPDVGPNNGWWPHYRPLADYVARLCALRREITPTVPVAIACDPHHLPWRAAKLLQQRQVEYDYVPATDVAVLAKYAQVIADGVPAMAGSIAAEQAGPPVLRCEPAVTDLRAWRGEAAGGHLVFVVNAGEAELRCEATIAPVGRVEVWDPLTGEMEVQPVTASRDGVQFKLRLERRQGLVYWLDPNAAPETVPAPRSHVAGEVAVTGWQWRRDGAWRPVQLGDWCAERELETYSGAITYRAEVVWPADGQAELDLGRVGELAAVRVDGQPAGARLWAPYRFDLGQRDAGAHAVIEVDVTNSWANAYAGAMRPSGLFGPVTLRTLTDMV